MRILVTGASGFIGKPICRRLVEMGHDVVALSRKQPRKACLESESIQMVCGDITSFSDVAAAMEQCDSCFHLAALAKPFSKHSSDFDRINVEGTRNILQSAIPAKLKRVVFTSTASVFGPSTLVHPTTEQSPVIRTANTAYERSKIQCESVVHEFQAQSLDVVTVYPSRVFGPGPLHASNSFTHIIKLFLENKWRFVPGNGTAIGNYVFIDDVVDGHLRAMFRGKPNECYLLGGENLSFNQIVEHLHSIVPNQQRMFHVPRSILRLLGSLQLGSAKLFGTTPRITPAFVDKYLNNWCLDCEKAVHELDWRPTPFVDALKQTISWLQAN